MNKGFYKFENNQLLYTPNSVMGTDYILTNATYDKYTYPIDGWYWFNSEDEANTFFGIEPPIIIEQNIDIIL